MQQTIAEITEKEFGESPTAVEEILGKGQVNLGYKISIKDRTYILRMKKGADVLIFIKRKGGACSKCESWASQPRTIYVGQRG